MARWPKTASELAADGYQGDNWAKCRDCGAKILWSHTPNGKKMPMEAVAKEGDETRYQSHFTTCPKANQRRTT